MTQDTQTTNLSTEAVYNGEVISDQRYGDDYLREFHDLLRQYAKHEIKSVLEWGSGSTTKVLYELCKERGGELLVTIDNNKEYLNSFMKVLPEDPMLLAKYMDITGPCRNQTDQGLNYSCFPLSFGQKFDVIFVDGRRRMECMLMAAILSDADTVVLLHDYRRLRYQPMNLLFDTLHKGEQFRVFRLKRAVLDATAAEREELLYLFKGKE